ncbi:MAG: helix-turn-helix transcriptional regulator [Candidatus Gastranaerophilales bacterium]|nr:helix-turn-helix transcriptional regulator [Candidatus Gastranaerophilales bacterium]
MNFREHFENRHLSDVLLRELTEKEIEVIEKIAEGLTINEVAKDLIIAISTVKTHLSNIRSKFKFSQSDIVNIRVMLCIFWEKYGSLIKKSSSCTTA